MEKIVVLGLENAPQSILNSIDHNYDSYTKNIIDLWYEHYLSSFTEFLEEDLIYCNNHSSIDNEQSLKCKNDFDSFSINNSKAKLKYPIGLMTLDEYRLLNIADYSFNNALLMDTYSISDQLYYNLSKPESVNSTRYIRLGKIKPVILLKKDTTYSTGDGTKQNPYVFNGIINRYNVIIDDENQIGLFKFEIEDLSQVESKEEVNFNITPIKGYQVNSIKIVDKDNNEIKYNTTDNKNYTFIMPASDVIVKPIYRKIEPINILDKLKNPDTGDKTTLIMILMLVSLGFEILIYKKKESRK